VSPEELAVALGAAKRIGRDWYCLCPAHNDHNPSLSITEKNGRLLFICRAGCDQDLVVAALRTRGLWPPEQTRRREISTVYNYRDAKGELGYQVVRYVGKKFLHRRPNGAPDAFIWNMDGVQPLPYRLPEMLADPTATIFICEGEKDCDNAAELGLITSCNHGGAGKWRPEISIWFKDRNVVLLPDNDDVGRAHMADVAAKLAGIAKTICPVELPGLADKGDVSNWIVAGGTAEQLWALVANAPRLTKVTPEPHPVGREPLWPRLLGDAAYHGIAGEFVSLIEPESESDPAALLLQFLTMAGNWLSERCYVRVETGRHFPNLFCCLVGDTSKARKGTSHAWVERVFTIADPVWAKTRRTSGLSSGEGLIECVRDRRVENKWDRASKSFVDEVIDEGISDKRLLVVEQELARVLRAMQRRDNILSAVLRDAWDGHDLGIMTKKNSSRATEPRIAIISHITVAELQAELTELSAANGFANRFVFAAVKRSKALPFGGNVEHDALETLLYYSVKIVHTAVL
jgi:hypothetical protein